LSGLAWIVVDEQCFIFFPLLQSSTCKIHMFQILKTILRSCNELAQCFRTLSMSLNEKTLIHQYLWHQQRKNLLNIFEQHTRPNSNIFFLNVQKRKFFFSTLTFTLLMSILLPLTHW
jgi:hypothetical protein